MRLTILVAFACATAACGSAQEDAATSDQAYSKFEGTDFVRAGWTAKAVLDGRNSSEASEFSGRLVPVRGGFVDVIQDAAGGGIFVADPSADQPKQIGTDPGVRAGGVIDALDSSVVFDNGFYNGSSRRSNSLVFSAQKDGVWKRETIDAKLVAADERGPSVIDGVCLVERAGVKTVVYKIGYTSIRIAERTDAGWKVQKLVTPIALGTPLSCAVSGKDLFVLVGGSSAHDPLRVLHQVSGAAVTSEPVSSADTIAASTITVDGAGNPTIAYADGTMHLATRSATGWTTTAVSAPFDASQTHSLALSFVGSDPVLFAVAGKRHPTERTAKDELWIMRQGASSAAQVEAYSPSSGTLQVTGSAIIGSKATVGVIEWQNGGDFRHLIVSGAL
ncbi:MAG: hypothetical protein QOI41_4348 [Myxococcales bacterium]|jgi:hypothetical protein|nr:hypothetical protein [Myxococcales bacterium]